MTTISVSDDTEKIQKFLPKEMMNRVQCTINCDQIQSAFEKNNFGCVLKKI